MDEYVLAAVFRLNESIAFFVIIELHGSDLHSGNLRWMCVLGRALVRVSHRLSILGEDLNERPSGAMELWLFSIVPIMPPTEYLNEL